MRTEGDQTIRTADEGKAFKRMEFDVGPMEVWFETDTLFLRRIRWQGQEVIRAIYGAVRDRNWGTLRPVMSNLQVQRSPHDFSISFNASCRHEDVEFDWTGRITGDLRGLRFEFDGTARRTFLSNRIGLCVLHPIQSAGLECEVEHVDGSRQKGNFPSCISPFQPFVDLRAVRHACGSDAGMEIRFEGDVFEMEDQRNWSDSSFKTYGTPLRLPFPRQIRQGDRVQQAVTVRFETTTRGFSTPVRWKREPVILNVDFHRKRRRPAVGFETTQAAAESSDFSIEPLTAVKPDHLRVECRLSEPGWSDALFQADQRATQIGAGLHPAIFLGADRVRQLETLAVRARELSAPVKLWLVYDEETAVTQMSTIATARSVLGGISPSAGFAAGTNAHFTELNRERPPVSADWFPCFSLTPQVHAFDDLTLIENLEAQADVARDASELTRQAVVISPITLLPSAGRTRRYDARQSSELVAGWTLGSLAFLSGAGNIHSVTYYETSGPGGILDRIGKPYPVWFVFRAVAELETLVPVERLGSAWECDVSALAGASLKQKSVLVANHRNEPVRVKIQVGAQSSALEFELVTGEKLTASNGVVEMPALSVICAKVL